MKNLFTSLIFVSFFVTSCTTSKDDKNSIFYYKSLKDCNFQMFDLNEKSKLTVLSYSAGNISNGEKKYYSQLIAINQITKDTIRVITPIEKYELHYGLNVSFSKNIFDIDKLLTSISNTEFEDKRINLKEIKKNNKFKELVSFNLKNKALELNDYKTTIGSLIIKH